MSTRLAPDPVHLESLCESVDKIGDEIGEVIAAAAGEVDQPFTHEGRTALLHLRAWGDQLDRAARDAREGAA